MIPKSSIVAEKDVQTFHRDGVVVLRGLLSLQEVKELQRDSDETIRNPGPLYEQQDKGDSDGCGIFHDDMQMWLRLPAMRHACLSSLLPQAAQELMTVRSSDAEVVRHPGVNLFFDELFIKEPGTKAPTPWHNDMSYWQLKPDNHTFQSLSMWCALDHVSSDTAVWYLGGSHHEQIHHRIANFGGRESKYASNTQTASLPADLLDPHSKNDSSNLEGDGLQGDEKNGSSDPVPHPQDKRILRWNLQPGDVVVHDSWLVHMAPGNCSSTQRRRGYVVRYTADGARFDGRPGTMHQWWNSCNVKANLGTGDCLGKSPLFPPVIGPRHMTLSNGEQENQDLDLEDGKRSRSNSKM